MYNKIASIILNSAKAAGLSDVYVAQPDSLKENLAGKIFVLAEIGGKKNDGRKVFDFLVSALEDNYYNDEKILFRGKIEGLKIENIFEAAVTKTNKNLADFLTAEKIQINPHAANITIGVIYENKLHFANFGGNRALLVYRHGENYELINVEANAAEAPDNVEAGEPVAAKSTKLFSSVISGEIPLSSYFVFTSEALPEYLSGKELINILTKLPPITAAEQIKSILAKMNTYVPFLGIIIKNTTGLPGQETREELEEKLAARSSVSSLNYTEEKTEQMLAPAGLINFAKLFRQFKELAGRWPKAGLSARKKKYLRPEESARVVPSAPELGQIKSLSSVRADSFLIKEKIFFKKKPGWPGILLKKSGQYVVSLFSPETWSGLSAKLKNWVKALSPKNRWLFGALGLLVVIFIGSLLFTNWRHERQLAQAEFTRLAAAIEEKENAIDAHLLYNDEAGAGQLLLEAQALIASLPQRTKDEQAGYQRLAERLAAMSEKIQKIVKVGAADKVNDLSGLGAESLVYAAGKLYAAGGNTIYELTPGRADSVKSSLDGVSRLSRPDFEGGDYIYYQAAGQLARFNIKSKASNLIKITGSDFSQSAAFRIFNGNLYALIPGQGQIYKYTKFATKSDWLKAEADLSRAVDLGIDGSIYVLNSDGRVQKFYLNKPADYSAAPLMPTMTGASKLIVGDKLLYVFEGGSKRLAVLAKSDGHLINQYVVDSLDQPRDVAVDEAGRIAYFLAGETVYKISLNQ
ncbi:MAG: hypothetical protein WC453_02250 [Patescibacteria group bacterium]